MAGIVFRDFRQGIRNVVRWLPIIWRDRDWDWVYLATIMRAKLIWMAEHEEQNGSHTTSRGDARRQRLCAELLRRLMADEYEDKASAHLPEITYTYQQDDSGTTRVVFDRSLDLEWMRVGKHSRAMQKQDSEMFGRLIGKHLTSWWD